MCQIEIVLYYICGTKAEPSMSKNFICQETRLNELEPSYFPVCDQSYFAQILHFRKTTTDNTFNEGLKKTRKV